MKRINIYLGVLLMLFASVAFAQPAQLTFRFTNPTVTPGSPDIFEFDIEVMADQAGTAYANISVLFDYNTDGFGADISGTALATLAPAYASYFQTPNSYQAPNSLLLGASKFPPIFSGLTQVSTSFEPLMHITIPIVDNYQVAGVQFNPSPLMVNQNNYVTVSSPFPTVYDVVFDNDLMDFPLWINDPLPFFISEVADPETPDASAKFIEIYNPSSLPYDFSYFNVWINRTVTAGWDGDQLTGVIQPMSTYVLASSTSAFPAAYGFEADQYVSTSITGNGDDAMCLTQDDEAQNGGTIVDFFGVFGISGDGEDWDYTDSKAVRKYSVSSPNPTFTISEWAVGPINKFAPGSGDLVQYASDMTPGSHRADLTFNGTASSAWRDKANWTGTVMDYIPDAGHNAIIPGPGAVIDEVTFAYCNDLSITGTNLTILSTPAGDGSLITYGTVTGLADVQKYLPADRWNYVSPPVGNAIANTFIHTWLYTYDAPLADWDQFIVPEATPLAPLAGYANWTSTTMQWNQNLPPVGDTTTTYEDGPLNNGPYNTTLGYGTGTWGDGYNFVGNPYVSGIDWETGGVDRGALSSDGFVVFNGTVNGQYTSGGGGTNGTSQYIAAQQGFFVQTNPGGGNFGVDNSARTHTAQAFLKSEQVFADRLSMTLSGDHEYSDETVIYFNTNATAGKDFSYDGDKFFATDKHQLYTETDGIKRAINTFNNMTETPRVNMGVNIMEAGNFVITASNIESFDVSTPIFLEDLKTGTITNLRESDTYSFTSTPEDDPMRFIVHFADPLGIDDPINANVNNIYSYNRDVYVNFTGNKGEIAIYNLIGQEVSRTAAINGLNKIALTQGNSAYIVKVISDNTYVSKKVFIK